MPLDNHEWDLVHLPDDGEGTRRHYRIKSRCSCGWESRDYRAWGQARNAGLKHVRSVTR